MIKVNKDYNDIPRILLSDNVEKAIEDSKTKNGLGFKSYYYANKEVVDKLNLIYSNKCAYCESLSKIEIDKYRPKSNYYWLAYEWSNLLSCCDDCNSSKSYKFPLINENNRVTKPQISKSDWLANSESFLNEGALLLNPEIDNPEDHLSFFPDGRMEGLTERGETTISILNLNRDILILKRSSLILMFQRGFEQKLQYAKELLEDEKSLNSKKALTILKLAFEQTFNELILQTKSDKEFALLGRVMFEKFDGFFINQLKNEKDKEILSKSFSIFKTELKQKESITDYNFKIEKKKEKKLSIKSVKIKLIKIKNIKCFDDVVIDFKSNNSVLLGINGRGKTTILQLIALGLSGVQSPHFESEWKNVIKNNNEKANYEIVLESGDQEFHLQYNVTKSDNVVFSSFTKISPLNSNIIVEQIENLQNTDNELTLSDLTKTKISNFFFVAYGTGRNAEHHNFPLNENFKNIATLFGINNLSFQNGEISDYLNQRNAFAQIKAIITKIFNQAEDIQNRVELNSFDKRTNTFYFLTPTNPEVEIPLNSMSSGFRTSFQWILDFVIQIWKNGFDLEQPELIAGIVLIDEIDTHLHIKWQRTILYSLHEVFKQIQFIVTTHSPFVVQSLENNNIIALQLDNKANNVQIQQIENVFGSSYESIINEIFDERSIFSVGIEKLFTVFYAKRDMILKKETNIEDAEFQKIISDLRQKGEEVNNIVNRELRRLNFLMQNS